MSVISVAEIENASGVLTVGLRDILTPLAADRARELGIRIDRAANAVPKASATSAPRVALGAPQSQRSVSGGAPKQPALSGALYRRGAPVPASLRVDVGARSAATPVADTRPNVAVVGAGHVGAMTALRLSETSLFSRTMLIDIVPGLAAGLALDMWHSSGLRGFTTKIEGSTDLSALEGAEFVVVTAEGVRRQPGMSRTDLTAVNAEIIGSVAEGIYGATPPASGRGCGDQSARRDDASDGEKDRLFSCNA